jgi:hypothetical protein
MIALDTNVLVRLVMNDDKKQTAASLRLLQSEERVVLLNTVLLETVSCPSPGQKQRPYRRHWSGSATAWTSPTPFTSPQQLLRDAAPSTASTETSQNRRREKWLVLWSSRPDGCPWKELHSAPGFIRRPETEGLRRLARAALGRRGRTEVFVYRFTASKKI